MRVLLLALLAYLGCVLRPGGSADAPGTVGWAAGRAHLEQLAVPLADLPMAIREGRERTEEEGRHEALVSGLLLQDGVAGVPALATRRHATCSGRADGAPDGCAPDWLLLRHLLI
jgi:hypothetical protein